jgi:hypothetical protein
MKTCGVADSLLLAKLLLALASTVILGSESHGTHDHILHSDGFGSLQSNLIRGVEGVVPPFLNSALDGGERKTSRPGRFTLGEIASRTHWIGSWVGFLVGRGAWNREKSLAFAGTRILAFLLVARCYTDRAIPALMASYE